jgi:23S rRNA (adenine2503-C2)-methyltransferase
MTELGFKLGIEAVSALPEEWSAVMAEMGEPRFRGDQIFDWIQRRSVCDPFAMTNLPSPLRVALGEAGLRWPVRPGRLLKAADGTRKIEMRLSRGGAVETVLIPEEEKITQCVSTQLGCAVGCIFCRSGTSGLKGNLTAAEIVSQIHLAKSEHLPRERLRNIVFMGVGEPLHNVNALLRALELIDHVKGLDLSTRRVTVSTVGFVRGIDRLAEATNGNVALAVSLHAADDATRRRLVPGVSDRLKDIVAALARYPLPKRRRITIEYVLVEGINDSEADARRLVKLLAPLRVKVNLLPLNVHDRTDLKPPGETAVLQFQKVLTDKGLSVFLRKRRGDDIGAACGQLLSFQ